MVFVRDERIRLTLKEFDLLRLLVANQGKPLRDRKILQSVWGPGYRNETEIPSSFLFISSERKLSVTPANLGLFAPNRGWVTGSNGLPIR